MRSDFSWMIPVEVMLGALDHEEVHSCSISKIPPMLRAPNEDAYKPKLVSLGPWHKGATRQLLLMEEAKLRYMRDFLERRETGTDTRTSELRLRDCAVDMISMDKAITACYSGDTEMDSHELSRIMIVDGCFLLELLIRLGYYMSKKNSNDDDDDDDSYLGDPLFETEEKVRSVLNDIVMLENQIPLIVLKKLYYNVFPDEDIEVKDDHRVANIVFGAFGYTPVRISSGAAHILHLIHLATVEERDQLEKKRGVKASQELKRCATRLRASGITIRTAANSKGNGKVPDLFEDIFDFDIRFNEKDKVLEIPALRIKETTEVRWRNLVAWEQSRIWVKRKYTSYAFFFKGLICCKHDIELLEKKGVIVNDSKKKKEELLSMFRKICKGSEHMDPGYGGICECLNQYEAESRNAFRGLGIRSWHRCRKVFEILMYYVWNWYDALIRDHIPTVWKFIGVVAAIVLLVLTIMQTYYSARSSG
ncbi:UPF0481 protein At3g47200-like [Arachis stenosperma]|uniref:UPF0481 protein At3g47200-like n=1 Tax=Arachis stenosperma TaxID=217475 RepID=UPI0025ACB1F1|nr:UPF0481 protein At3g47200-like [Arachis stenosperma]XP_057742425.1 UPF0481 protein At3g47200-like [Arachis stenosperma]